MTKPPDQRRLEGDLLDAPFLAGVAAGHWGLADADLAPEVVWPQAVFWVGAAPRKGSPSRFHLRLDCQGYPSPPTGTFWDPVTRQQLIAVSWPKGRGQVTAVFRTDWEGGRALYHPFDRVAAGGHGDWRTKYPHLVWDPAIHTIVDFLGMVHDLLNRGDYTGT